MDEWSTYLFDAKKYDVCAKSLQAASVLKESITQKSIVVNAVATNSLGPDTGFGIRHAYLSLIGMSAPHAYADGPQPHRSPTFATTHSH